MSFFYLGVESSIISSISSKKSNSLEGDFYTGSFFTTYDFFWLLKVSSPIKSSISSKSKS